MKKQEKCNGVIVPMVTPFSDDGHIDLEAAGAITTNMVTHGCIPFILGTTGEATSISGNQKLRFAEKVVAQTNGQCPVYAGIASTCFEDSVRLAEDFASAGVDYVVSHPPYFYPLNAQQLKAYYVELADAVPVPLILYNIPATTHISIPFDVVVNLSEHPNIIGIKDSERDLERLEKTIDFCKNREGFCHLVGWGTQIAYALSLGSDGLVPSTGNIIPGKYKEMYDSAVNRDFAEANRLQAETDSVSAIYQEGRNLGDSLAALKVMMHAFGLCKKKMLLPLRQLSQEEEHQVLLKMSELNVR